MRLVQTPYGEKVFERIRFEGLHDVDKTAFIRTVEARADILFFEA